MSDDKAPQGSLGDFFKSKGKKKIKATNLNNAKAEAKPEEKKSKTKTEDDQWEEDTVVAATIKGVEVAGKLQKEEDEQGDEGKSAPAWKTEKAKDAPTKDDKRYPTLQKSCQNFSSAITVGDGEAKINIETSKNAFAALEGDEGSDDDVKKKTTTINSAMVSKRKGEREKDVVQRAVDEAKKPEKKFKKKEKTNDDEDEDDDEEEDEEEVEAPAETEVKEKKKNREEETRGHESRDQGRRGGCRGSEDGKRYRGFEGKVC